MHTVAGWMHTITALDSAIPGSAIHALPTAGFQGVAGPLEPGRRAG